MANLSEYLNKRGITEAQMDIARAQTQTLIETYSLREARKACGITQEKLAETIGVSQNRVSRMENGDPDAMSLGALRRYIEALGGRLTLIADLPTGQVSLA